MCVAQVSELIFYKIQKKFKISNKIYTESFILMKLDDKFLNCCNWFKNNRIMTLLHFDLRKHVRCTGFRTHFLQNSKKIQNKQQNLHRKRHIDET